MHLAPFNLDLLEILPVDFSKYGNSIDLCLGYPKIGTRGHKKMTRREGTSKSNITRCGANLLQRRAGPRYAFGTLQLGISENLSRGISYDYFLFDRSIFGLS